MLPLLLLIFLQHWLALSNAAFVEFGLDDSKDDVGDPSDGFGKMSATVKKARVMTAGSRFHTFIGRKQEVDGFRLNYLCSYSDSTYQKYVMKLGSGGSVLAYLDKSMYDAVDRPSSYQFMSIDISPNAIIQAYVTMLGMLGCGSDSTKNLGLLGVIFESDAAAQKLTFNFVFENDLAPKLVLEFYKMFAHFAQEAVPPHSKNITFNKDPVNNLAFQWELRVASLPEPLIVFQNMELLFCLVDLIPPMLLNDISLVRGDAAEIIAAGNLPTVVLSTCATKVEKITLEALKNIEMLNLTIFGCRLNREIDAVIAIDFSKLFKEPTGATTIDINFRCDPGKGVAVLERVGRAVTELDGLWQFSEKYFCPEFWSVVTCKPAIMEYWYDKAVEISYHINSLNELMRLKDEAWAKDSLKPGAHITMRHPEIIKDSNPFTRIAYAEFFKCDLPIIICRVYDMLFVNHAAPWVDLVDYVVLRPTKDAQVNTGSQTFEIIVAFRQGPEIDNISLQKMMADLFCGIAAARAFANGLMKNADGKVPLLQYSHEDYHREQLAEIQKRVRKVKPVGVAVEFKGFQVYSCLYSTASFSPMGPVETAFDDVFLDSLNFERKIGNFLILGKEPGKIHSNTCDFKIKRNSILPLIRNIVRFCKSVKESDGEGNILDLVAFEFLTDPEDDNGLAIGIGFSMDSTEAQRAELFSQIGLGERKPYSRGDSGLVLDTIEPEPFDSAWTLTFKHGEVTIAKEFTDFSVLQNYLSWLKPSVMQTVELKNTGCVDQTTTVLNLDLKSGFVSHLLFDMDLWNMMENKSKMDLWRSITKLQFNPIIGHQMYELSAVFHLKPTTDVISFAGLMNNRVMRLVLVDSFKLIHCPEMAGYLQVGAYSKYISCTKAFLESIKDWPKTLGRKDALCFQRSASSLGSIPGNVKLQAIRLVMKAEKLAQLFAVSVDLLMGGFQGLISSDSFQFLVRPIKSKPEGTKRSRQKPQSNAECIWVFTRPFQDDQEVLAFSKIFSGTIGIYGVTPIDISTGWFAVKGQTFAPTKKLEFDLNLFMETFDEKAAVVQSGRVVEKKAGPTAVLRQEPSKKKRKAAPIKREELTKVESVPTEAIEESKPAEKRVEPVSPAVEHKVPDAFQVEETVQGVEDVIVKPERPKVSVSAPIALSLPSSRRRIPLNTLF